MDIIVPCNSCSQAGTVFISRLINWFKIEVGIRYDGV